MPGARQLIWHDNIAINQTVLTDAQAAIDLTAGMIDADKRGCTITRVLYQLFVRANTVDAAANFHYGITLMHEDATGAAVPDADEQTDEPGWLTRMGGFVMMTNLADGSQVYRAEGDLRAQRKFRGPSEQLQFIIDQDVSCQINCLAPGILYLPIYESSAYYLTSFAPRRDFLAFRLERLRRLKIRRTPCRAASVIAVLSAIPTSPEIEAMTALLPM
jgi:hypothetical protein